MCLCHACSCQEILRTETAGQVIMPVHSLQFLAHADWCVLLHPTDGTIREQGPYAELLQAGGEFARMMSEHASVTHDDESHGSVIGTDDGAVVQAQRPESSGSAEAPRLSHGRRSDSGQEGKGRGTGSSSDQLMTVEERAVGSVDRGVWIYYAKACGVALSWLVILCYVGGMGAKILTDWWMSRWSVADNSVLLGYDETWSAARVTAAFLSVYAVLGAVVVAMNAVKTVIVSLIGLRAARNLHSGMLGALLRAPTSFYDRTPVGRIVNRFSSDMTSIDMGLVDMFLSMAEQLFTLVGVFGVILLVFPPFLVIVPPLFLFYFRMQRRYRNATRELKRLHSITKSPIFSHFQETLAGLTCVRAYGEQQRFISTSDRNVDQNMRFRLVMVRLVYALCF
jgi:ATP-binding cassette subfamily C (CFTR/MRP) protein 1